MSASIVPSTNGTGNEQYESLVKELSGERFLKIHLRIIQFFRGDCDQAVVLAFILNKLSMRLNNRKDRKLLKRSGYWLRCPVKDMAQDLGMFKGKITRRVEKLRKLMAIETKHGKGFTQWVKVRLDWMEAINDASGSKMKRLQNRPASGAKIDPLADPKQTRYIHGEPSKETKKRTPSRKTGGTDHPDYYSSLERLCTAYYRKLRTENKIISSTTSSAQWPKMAVKFINKLDGGYPLFKKTIKAYVAEFDPADPYMPQAYSMRSLLDNNGRKFLQIVGWLDRNEVQAKQVDDNTKVWQGHRYTRTNRFHFGNRIYERAGGVYEWANGSMYELVN